ncbi:hypothetical protein AN958_07477 [Leucoagaricus sp. SymC.cos]|nr:hypothetical protein AN958_07477 [Leucoagaricus sp. SymC.cos]
MADKRSPNKKQKLETTKKSISVEYLRQSLQAQNPDTIVEALNQLGKQLTIRSDEGVIAPQDERLVFVERWLEKSPEAHDVFTLWESMNPRQTNLQVAIVSVLAVLLPLLSSHYTYHPLGYPIVKTLLNQQCMKRLHSYVGGTHNELTLVTLKLLNAISGFAGGREKKTLLEVFQWEIKSLPKILTLRRKGRTDYNPLSRPDIRTLYILFLISFLEGQAQVKSTFLEQHRDTFLAILKGLPQDHYLLIRHVLEAIWINLWSDPKIKRTTKVGLFNETSILHLLKIYERTSSSDEDPEHIPADLVHHFLLAIMTHPGVGVCFKDRGWYPREDGEDGKGGKIYNKILANILKTLKVNEDSRQQELARKILEASPELVAGYWPSAQLTLEPRLSTKWIANIAFFGTIISFPVPRPSFYLPGTELYNPAPPPLQTILSNILPSDVGSKNILTKGLLSSSGLVQHCTALTLAKCLRKYAHVLQVFREVERALEISDTEEGPWAQRRKEVEKEIRRRVPEFQVILGFSQPKLASTQAGAQVTPASIKPPNPVRSALLQEIARRLLFLYHKHLPEVVAEARFDVGKALVNFDASVVDKLDVGDDEIPEAAKRLYLIRKMHILRTLKESDQFVWTNKFSHTELTLALRATLLDLLSHLLSSSILFEETPHEPNLWIASLPCPLHPPNVMSPDHVRLTDEAESVVTFLDDCIQRCLKTPFRYIEEMRNVSTSLNPDAQVFPSPLVMTVAEQLDAKIKAGVLTASDVLAIASFMRILLFRLVGQVQDLTFLQALVLRVDEVLDESKLWKDKHPLMTAAVRTEVQMMNMVVKPAQRVASEAVDDQKLKVYLDEMDEMTSVDGRYNKILRAHSIISRLRLAHQPLPLPIIKRLILAAQTHWAPALPTLAQYLFPRSGTLWENHIIVGSDVGETIPPEWILFNASNEQLLDSDYRRSFIAALFSTKPKLQSSMGLIRHIEHRLDVKDSFVARGLFILLGVFLREARSVYTEAEIVSLKELLFIHPGTCKRIAMASETDNNLIAGLRELLESSFNPTSLTDREVLSEISAHWLTLIQASTIQEDLFFDSAALWTKFLPPEQLLLLLDEVLPRHSLKPGLANTLVLPTLNVIRAAAFDDISVQHALWERLPQLLAVRKQLSGSLPVEELILFAIDSTLPVGLSGVHSGILNHRLTFTGEVQRASSCWARKSQRLDDDTVLEDILNSSIWTPVTAQVVSSIAYKQGLDFQKFETWLKSEHSTSRSPEDLATILHSALDIYQCRLSAETSLSPATWMPHMQDIVSLGFNATVEPLVRQMACSCVVLALKSFHNATQGLIQLVNDAVQSNRSLSTPFEAIRIGIYASELSLVLLDWSLQTLITDLADDTFLTTRKQRHIRATISLVRASAPKSHQVETLLGVIIQHHLPHPCAVELAHACISRTHLKPVAANRYLQNILHHPQFFKLANAAISDTNVRSSIVDLLHTLFNLHPTNTCQITQVEPLIRIYHGTLSKADLLLFSIFQLFEIQRNISLTSLLIRWSSSSDIVCSSALEALQTLDPTVVFRTTLHYPKWRKLQSKPAFAGNSHDRQLYDPVFLLLFCHLALSQDPPSTPFAWIELFRTNIVGLCFRVLSSKDPSIRTLSLSQLLATRKRIESLVFQEKPHVIYLFDLLKDLFIFPPENDAPRRLPSYTTLILAHALRGIFYPSNFIYPLTARFLLQRPEFDSGDVPMLYAMLYSNTDDWKKERGWILRFLADGMASTEDWRVLKRRHGWDLLASLFENSSSDLALRKSIFEVMASLTRNRQALMTMIFQSSFLAWFEMEVSQANDDEHIKWARLLANIVFTVDHANLNSAFQSSWKGCLWRCLCTLLSKREFHILHDQRKSDKFL